RRHRLLKLFGRTVEIILQRLRLRTEGLCHAERQIATGQRSKSAADRGDRNLIFLGSACLFGLVELAFALGHVANAFSLAFDTELFDCALLEDLNRPRHLADLIATIEAFNLN